MGVGGEGEHSLNYLDVRVRRNGGIILESVAGWGGA